MTDLFVGAAKLLSKDAFDSTVADLKVDPESLWSLLAVETRGFGFLPDRRLKILFERHIFSKRTGGAFDSARPDISNPVPGGYSGNAAEYPRLQAAMALNRKAALESASWGLPQIMGFNASGLGYGGAEDMIGKFTEGEDAQLEGAARFITANSELRTAFVNRNWKRVAFYYNGKNYAVNAYDKKLADHYEVYKVRGCPRIELRADQARLTFLGYDPRGVDGQDGPGTAAAVIAFQKTAGLPLSGHLDDATRQALAAKAGV